MRKKSAQKNELVVSLRRKIVRESVDDETRVPYGGFKV